MNSNAAERDQLLELLADQVMNELDPGDQQELQQLREAYPDVAAVDFDQVATLFELATLPAEIPALPRELREGILSLSAAPNAADDEKTASLVVAPASHEAAEYQGSPFREWLGWMVAAGLFIAILLSLEPSKGRDSLTAQRDSLAQAADVVKIAWEKTGDAAARQASGDVIWSTALQQGYMRLAGLKTNDPTMQQYQLWIIDEGRPDSPPVDGGVFDITQDGEVIIPIQAKLRVFKPSAFAITIEKPGGVVVSQQERVPLLAKLERA